VQEPVSGLQIWSLSEIMRSYNVWQLAHSLAYLTQMQLDAEERLRAQEDAKVPVERMNNWYVPLLKLCQAECERLELTAAINRMHPFNLEIRQGISWSEMRNQAKALLEAIHSELCFRRFAFVTTAKATLHDTFALQWGVIWTQFPDVKEDSQDAVDCYALEKNTACVFHMMRVAEMGLRSIAKKVKVKLTDKKEPLPVEFATWNKVIDGIKTKIAAVRTKPKSTRQNEQLQFYSDAADQCTYIRDLWRNDVSHHRKSFNDGEALGVLTRVQQLMEFLARKEGNGKSKP
jgi:hypothetical protein